MSLVGWSSLLFYVGGSLLLDPKGFRNADISVPLLWLQLVQLWQGLDMLLIVLRVSKGSLVGAFFQILGRNIVSLYFMRVEGDQLRFAMVVIIWAMADATWVL